MKKYLLGLIVVFILIFAGCAKEKDIVPDAFLVTVLSASIDSDTVEDGVIVNLHVYIEADEDVPIESMGVVLRNVEGDFKLDFADANIFPVASLEGQQKPGFMIIPVKYGLNTYLSGMTNFAVYAYSKGTLYNTRAVSLGRLRQAKDLGEVAYYPFDGNALDAYGRLNLTPGGSHTYVPGNLSTGTDLSFEFLTSYLHHSELDNYITGTSGRTFSFWFNATGGATTRVLTYGDGTSGEFSILFDTGNLVIYNGSNALHYPTSITEGAWHKALITMPQNALEAQIKVFMDGVPLSSTNVTPTLVNTTNGGGVWIGSGINGTNEATGLRLDDLRIWNRRLSRFAVEILTEND